VEQGLKPDSSLDYDWETSIMPTMWKIYEPILCSKYSTENKFGLSHEQVDLSLDLFIQFLALQTIYDPPHLVTHNAGHGIRVMQVTQTRNSDLNDSIHIQGDKSRNSDVDKS
jgi:hypothetical protein